MAEQAAGTPPPYARESGIVLDKSLADEARSEALNIFQNLTPSGEPLQFLQHTENSRDVSNIYLAHNKAELAKFLKISPPNLDKRYLGSELCVCNNLGAERLIKSRRTNLILSILALGDLSYFNGLPKLGEERMEFELKVGELLHFRGDLDQHYSGNGGGVLLLFYWNANLMAV